MNINLNLATRPYIELRSVYARLRVIAVGLGVLALPMLLVLHAAETKARLSEARVNQLGSNIVLLRRQQANARALASQGANANVLTQAAFLNDLFRRKAFSWTATMSDLEGTLPTGVQVMFIDPVVAPDGRVTIRMRVTGVRERAVEVVHDLEHSRHFVAPRLVAEALANQSSGNGGQAQQVSILSGSPADVSFDILADYRPLPNSHTQTGLHTGVRAMASATPGAPNMPAQLTNPESVPSNTPAALPASRRPVRYGRALPAVPASARAR